MSKKLKIKKYHIYDTKLSYMMKQMCIFVRERNRTYFGKLERIISFITRTFRKEMMTKNHKCRRGIVR